MPKLLLFAPCEKVIVDQTTNTITLIAVLQELRYKTPPSFSPAPNSALPMQWSILTLWQEQEPDDSGVEFEQRVVLATSASPLLQNDARWRFEKPFQRVIANVVGFPLIQGVRRLGLHLSYRVAGATDWVPMTSFPIDVIQEVI